MLRFALLSVFLSSTSAFAQTADVLSEVIGSGGDSGLGRGPVTAVTYDLKKLMKANPELATVENVLKQVSPYGLLWEPNGRADPGDPVTILPGNRIVIQAHRSVHDLVEERLEKLQTAGKRSEAAGVLPPPGGLVPPGAFLPPQQPFGLRANIREALLNPPKKKKK